MPRDEHSVEMVGEVVTLADELEPDVVIMDVAMPLMSGDEATRRIKAQRPQTRVIALSMYEEAGMMEQMHQAGAESYVVKTAPTEELLAAIRGEQIGERAVGGSHPYRVPVKQKNTFLEPKNLRRGKVGSSACCYGLVFCRLTPTYRTVPALAVCFAAAKFLVVSFVESVCRRQTSLSCSHPSGSKRGTRELGSPGPGSIPTVSGPEQRQYRTMFPRGPSPGGTEQK
jgi:CheY-like chemotaxis protein